jgi:hypothetical protein
VPFGSDEGKGGPQMTGVLRLGASGNSRAPAALRDGALRVGEMTSSWRMLPGFIVVGAQRSGTTSLFSLLAEHPQVCRPAFSKGIGYFDLNYARGEQWYRGHFPVRHAARFRTRRWGHAVTFESSGYYMFHPLAAGRIARDLPGVRIVMMLRDPVERAASAHAHELARGFEVEADFSRALELEEERLRGEVERIVADPQYESHSHRHHAYLARGRYIEQIQQFRAAGLGDRLVVIDADAFFADQERVFLVLQRSLGLKAWTAPGARRLNVRPRISMDDDLRSRLREHFRPYDEQLEPFLGAMPTWLST